jgi:hypothetical protein
MFGSNLDSKMGDGRQEMGDRRRQEMGGDGVMQNSQIVKLN